MNFSTGSGLIWCRAFCICLVAISSLATSPIHAQWTVTNLQPSTSNSSFAQGNNGSQQVGYAYFGSGPQAVLWSGTSQSWISLNTAGADQSLAFAIDGSQQAGHLRFGNRFRATVWSGSAASAVNLHPGSDTTDSLVWGAGDGQQVGVFRSGSTDNDRPSVWSGTAASWVDLNPTGGQFGQATGASNGQQVGRVFVDGTFRASLWSGTAASWVDLTPSGGQNSNALDISDGWQVGDAFVDGVQRASLWNGTSESWVDLHPVGATSSFGLAIEGDWQAGYANINGASHAGVWNGSSETWEDLQLTLPSTVWSYSRANGIWTDGNTLFVSGYGRNEVNGRFEALLWSRSVAVPEPGSFALLSGGMLSILFRRRRRA